MQRHDDTQGEDSSGADIQVQVSPTLCSSQIASQNQITYPCDPLKSSTSTSTSPTNDSIDGSGPATPIWFSNTPEGIHGTLPGGRLGSLSPVLPACPGSHPTTSFVSGSGMSDSSSSHQRQSPSQTISQGYSPHLAEVDRQTEKLSEASGEHEEQVGEHCTARHQHEQSYDEASEREQPAGVYTFHMSSSSGASLSPYAAHRLKTCQKCVHQCLWDVRTWHVDVTLRLTLPSMVNLHGTVT